MDFELQARGEARFEAQRSCHQEVHQGDNAEKLLLKSLKDEARARKLDSRPWTLRGGSGVPTVPQPSLALHLFPGPLGHKSCLFHLHPLIPRTRSEGFTFLSGGLGVGPCSQRAAASDRACLLAPCHCGGFAGQAWGSRCMLAPRLVALCDKFAVWVRADVLGVTKTWQAKGLR